MDRNKKKGIFWFSIGVVALAIGLVCFRLTMTDTHGGVWLVAFFTWVIGIATGSLFVVLGAILFFVGKSEERKRMNGIILFWIGVVALVIGLVCLMLAFQAQEEGTGWLSIFIGATAIASLLVVIGAILFFVGKSEVKKAKNQNIPRDAQG